MLPLYPSIKPYAEHRLKVSEIHNIYFAEFGVKTGIPVICCHGGPGGESTDVLARLFDPEYFRIILFDQRGCGKSKPFHCLKENNTQYLIADMEEIRKYLNISKWIIAGGGWGSTLSLLYAEANSERVISLLLWSICLLRKRDLDWIYVDGVNRFFPEHWKKFISIIPDNERNNLFAAFHKRLTGDNELTRMSAAKSWSNWEAQCATLHLNKDIILKYRDPHTALNLALIANYYFLNNNFIEDNQILNNINKIAEIPMILVHGRYDMLSPLENAVLLHQNIGDAELDIIRDAGHAIVESGIVDALIRASKVILKQQGYFSDHKG